MLLELRIENLLLIERAELRPGPALNVITGETGAGKTVLAHAFDLLVGGRPRSAIVRPGADEAYVEAVFEAPPGLLDDGELADLRERIPLDGEELVLARRVAAGGRTRAFVQGRGATADDLRVLGGRLLALFGQHEHRKLALASAPLELLDGFCGREQLALRSALAQAHGRVRELELRLAQLGERAGARERDLDLLEFELNEIEALDPSAEEERDLLAERERLRRVDSLRGAAAAGAAALAPDEGPGAAGLLAEAERLSDAVAGADPGLDALAARLQALRLEAEDLGGELRRYLDGLEADPARLQQVEERLDALDRLKRKHGGSVDAVLAHAERCRADRERLLGSEVAREEAEADLAAAEAERRELSDRLGAARRAAAPALAERVERELAALAMERATFSVEIEPREQIGASGAERVDFVLAPNPGVPAASLRHAASGGELSRVMLALMNVAGTGEAQTLLFDEVDAGIGGQTARAVGERLRALAAERQLICVTHLPQLAALGDDHFRIEKSAAAELAHARVERLEGAEIVAELCRMLGADSSDAGARRHAEELLAA